jgi:hypothetical protein
VLADCPAVARPGRGALGALVAQFVDVTTRLRPRCGVPSEVEHMHNKPHMRVTATSGPGDEAARGPFPQIFAGPLASLSATHRCQFGKQPFTTKA